MFSQVSVCSQGEQGISGPRPFLVTGPMSLLGGGGVVLEGLLPPQEVQWDTVGKRVVCILLECFLVRNMSFDFFTKMGP